MMRLPTAWVLLGLCVSFLGCGPDTSKLPKTVPAAGVVTLDGNPVSGASVTCMADEGSHHATAVTDDAGKFSLRAFPEKEGAVPGSYKVEINKTVVTQAGDGTDSEAAVNVQYGLPSKYATTATSELTLTIPDAGTTSIKFDLTSK